MKKYGLLFSLVLIFTAAPCLAVHKWTLFALQDPGDGTPFVGGGKQAITQSGGWRLQDGGIYMPSGDGPMIRVEACDVIVDFNDYCITNGDTLGTNLVIGLEVGYTNAELSANPNLQQISNVTIRKPSFVNFDVGILVHRGVKNVTIEDGSFICPSYGIIFMGSGTTKETEIVCARVKDCKIIGHGENKVDQLAKLKDKIEGTQTGPTPCQYDYGVDTFMPLREDLFDGSTINTTAHTYAGIFMRYVKDACVQNCAIENIGYQDYENNSEGLDNRTEAVGIVARNCSEITLLKTKVFCIVSELKAVGMQVEQSDQIYVDDCEFAHNKSAVKAVGIESFDVTGGTGATVHEFDISKTKCDMHVAKEGSSSIVPLPTPRAMGADFSQTTGLHATDFSCENNLSSILSYGVFATDLHATDFTRCLLSKNEAKRSVNDIATDEGIAAQGMFLKDSSNLIIDYCVFDANAGKNCGLGCRLQDVDNCTFNHCEFFENHAEEERDGENAAIRAQQNIQEISKHGPVVSATQTGGYGFVAEATTGSCHHIVFDNCRSEGNFGHRAGGFVFKNCFNCELINCAASYQEAHGPLFSPEVATLDGTALDVLDVHKPLLFSTSCYGGGATTNPVFSTVNARIAMDKLLQNYEMFMNSYEVPDGYLTAANKFNTGTRIAIENINSYISLLYGAMARFRDWGVSFGVFAYNVEGFIIKDGRFVGQRSEYDTAAGICFAGRNRDFNVTGSIMSNNIGATATARSVWATTPDDQLHPHQYDLSSSKDFWWMIVGQNNANWNQAADNATVGLFTNSAGAPSQLVVQSEQVLGNATTDTNLPHVSPNGTERRLVSIFPEAAGILMGDLAVGGVIQENKIEGNCCNSGLAGGVFSHNAVHSCVGKNDIARTFANIHGLGFGIFDVTYHTTNVFVSNMLYNNAIKWHQNANLFIGYKTGSFPQQTVLHDELGPIFADTRELHNTIIRVIYDRHFSCHYEEEGDRGIEGNIIKVWTADAVLS